MQSIGIVIPCFNEEDTIKEFYKSAVSVFKVMNNSKHPYDYRLMFIDDGSKDKTLEILKELHRKNPQHVHYITFSCNFGIDADMVAGFKNLQTDYMAKMDADLQDPPTLIPKMMKHIRRGYDCVGCYQRGRKQSWIRKHLSNSFYKFINKISNINIQPNVRDFRMMTRPFVRSFLQLKERNRFAKGLFAWVGYKVKYIPYKSQPRYAGKSDWTLSDLFQYALEAIIDFSDIPLRIPTYLGFILGFISLIGFIATILSIILCMSVVTISLVLISLALLLASLQFLCIGIIGKYLGKTYVETKQRPLYIIKEKR